jgi:hypothetical protein
MNSLFPLYSKLDNAVPKTEINIPLNVPKPREIKTLEGSGVPVASDPLRRGSGVVFAPFPRQKRI